MPSTLKMPKLSPTMEGGTIVKWHKKEGDAIKADDLLFEVATDKATVEYNSLDDGILRKILIGENEEAVVNQPIAIFTETADESIEGYEVEGEKPKEVKSDAPKEEKPEEKKEAPPSSNSMAQPAFQAAPPLEDYTFEFDSTPAEHLPASPLAKKLAKEKGVDLSTVKGSGPDGRVMSRDLDLAQSDAVVAFGQRSGPTEKPGTFEEEPLSPMRKAIGQKLQASKTFIPHFYVQHDIDVEPMVASREELKVGGIKVTFNDYVMRATALALRQHPTVNSGYDSAKNTIIRFKTVDIAVAVSIDEGLITPIVRHVDYKNLGQIGAQVKQLAKKAKEGKLQPHEYQGGSFTISNLGMFGIHDFQAVINPPQVSILAVGGIRECAVVKEGQVVAGKRMMVSLSSDHRVVDGADAAAFLQTFKQLMENPSLLIV